MWNEDLDQFLEAWERDCMEREEMLASDSKGKKVKRKQAVLQTRKSLGGRKGSGDDDFVPIKAATTKRKPLVAKSAKLTVKEEDAIGSDQEVQIEQKRKAANKAIIKANGNEPRVKRKAATSRRKILEDTDADDDLFDEDSRPTKGATNKKTVTKTKAETDSEIDVSDRQKAKNKSKEKGKEATKRKSPTSENESDEDLDIKPAKKQKGSPAAQATVTDYFGKASNGHKAAEAPRKLSHKMKPASPPKTKKGNRRMIESDDEMDFDDLPKLPRSHGEGGARAARGGAKRYVEIVSSEEGEDGEASLFVDDDE
ncbi:hypothetical protein AX17_000356 [Amanita inopinata Kibby_2008]|nr:hypothetical protein AX17_000356 [Amanita inopinata Kibby_2008]